MSKYFPQSIATPSNDLTKPKTFDDIVDVTGEVHVVDVDEDKMIVFYDVDKNPILTMYLTKL